MPAVVPNPLFAARPPAEDVLLPFIASLALAGTPDDWQTGLATLQEAGIGSEPAHLPTYARHAGLSWADPLPLREERTGEPRWKKNNLWPT